MLFFLFIVSGLYVLAYARNRLAGIVAGAVLLMLACYTKQSAVYYLPFAFLYLFLQNWRQACCSARLRPRWCWACFSA